MCPSQWANMVGLKLVVGWSERPQTHLDVNEFNVQSRCVYTFSRWESSAGTRAVTMNHTEGPSTDTDFTSRDVPAGGRNEPWQASTTTELLPGRDLVPQPGCSSEAQWVIDNIVQWILQFSWKHQTVKYFLCPVLRIVFILFYFECTVFH